MTDEPTELAKHKLRYKDGDNIEHISNHVTFLKIAKGELSPHLLNR